MQFGESLITNETDVWKLFNTYFSQVEIWKFSNLETLYRILMQAHDQLI